MGLVALVFFLGVLVAAGLARAVLQLEAAAGRIAAGDFETAVGVRGIKEIEDLADAMDGMRATLREDRDQRARFLAAVSHDLQDAPHFDRTAISRRSRTASRTIRRPWSDTCGS